MDHCNAERDIHLGDIHHEQDDVRHIDLPGSLDEAGSADQDPALEHDTRVDKGSRVAEDENEQIGGVAEPVVPLGNPVDRVVRNVVEKDRPVGNTAQQVEALVANLRGRITSIVMGIAL